jgi:hypothetical protein
MSTDALRVEAMAGYGLPAEDIAQVLRLDIEELRRQYAAELEDGRIKANSRVAENLFRKATGDGREAVVAAIFWLKTRAQWRETTVTELRITHEEALAQLE